MDVVSWIVLGGVIVLSAVGVALWNRIGRRSSPMNRLDADAAKDVREAQARVERHSGGPPVPPLGGGAM
jgi:HAMP domain-containing protein